MGRAADNHQLLIQPYQLLELMPLLAELYEEGVSRGLLLQPGNNIGFFGPYESVLRGSGNEGIHWVACTAGRNMIGIEADGTIKGCPSLPTASYAGGNVRNVSLVELWNAAPKLAFTRRHRGAELWASAHLVITRMFAKAAAPGRRTRSWASLATTRTVTIAR